MNELPDPHVLEAIAGRLDGWLADARRTNPVVEAVERADPGTNEHRWYVRLRGEDKDVTTIWFTLGQRTLRYETYVMPAPEENHEALYEHLLRRNDRLVGAHFSIGDEDAIYLRGELPAAHVDESELDRVIGTVFHAVEQWFATLVGIGFASRASRR